MATVRLSPDGNVRRDGNFANDISSPSFPHAVWTGSHAVIAWTFSGSGSSNRGIVAQRVTADGTPLDRAPFLVSMGGDPQFRPTVATDGTQYLVAWDSGYASRVTAEGRIRDPERIKLTQNQSGPGEIASAWNGATYLVTWDQSTYFGSEVQAARVSSDGQAPDFEPIRLQRDPDVELNPAVASNGGEFLVVWQHGSSFIRPPEAVWAARVSSDGSVVDDPPIELAPITRHLSIRPAVVWDGRNYVVVWSDETNLSAARIAADGTVVDPTPIALARRVDKEVTAASDGTQSLIAWARDGDILAIRLSNEGIVLDENPIQVTEGPVERSIPRAVWDGVNFLVAWDEPREDGDFDVMGARVSPSGAVIDQTSFRLASTSSWSPQVQLASHTVGRAALVYVQLDPLRTNTFRAYLRFIEEPG